MQELKVWGFSSSSVCTDSLSSGFPWVGKCLAISTLPPRALHMLLSGAGHCCTWAGGWWTHQSCVLAPAECPTLPHSWDEWDKRVLIELGTVHLVLLTYLSLLRRH